jgi:hypothetical protein
MNVKKLLNIKLNATYYNKMAHTLSDTIFFILYTYMYIYIYIYIYMVIHILSYKFLLYNLHIYIVFV